MTPEMEAQNMEREKKARVIANAYHRLFNSDDGRVVLGDLKKRFGLEAPIFTPISKGDHSAYDPLTAALTDGGRRVVIHILQILALPMMGDGNIEPKKKPTVRKSK